MKKLLALILTLYASAAIAQGDIPNHSMPIGKGPGVIGWGAVGPCAASQTVFWSGSTVDPACSNFLVGVGGTNGQVQYNNNGVLGGYTNTQLTALINPFTSTLTGAVPASGGGTTNFLRADGNWAAAITTPAGASGTVQYNNSSAFGGMSGTAWVDASRVLTMTNNLAANTSGDGLVFEAGTAATNGNQYNSQRLRLTANSWDTTNNASHPSDWIIEAKGIQGVATQPGFGADLVISGQRNGGGYTEWMRFVNSSWVAGGSSKFIQFNGGSLGGIIQDPAASVCVCVSSQSVRIQGSDSGNQVTVNTFGVFTSGTFQFGLADAASPVAQTVQAQSVVAGTTDTAGADWTINASRGTGTGVGGNIIIRTAPPSTTGSTQNALVTAMIVDDLGHIRVGAGTAPALTSCGGGSPSILGTDEAGEVTMGTTATGCVITFNKPYVSAPFCVLNWQATPLASQSWTVSNSAITTTQTSTSGNILNYICRARNGG